MSKVSLFKKVAVSAMAVVMSLCVTAAADAADTADTVSTATVKDIASETGISVMNSNARSADEKEIGYFTVEHASGEVDVYKIEDLLQDCVSICNDQVDKVNPDFYLITEPDNQSSDISLQSTSSTTRQFYWTIKRNYTTYGSTVMKLDVGDVVSFDFMAHTSNYYDFEVGLWNTVNNTFAPAKVIFGDIPNPITKSSFTMAVGGNFSFAIRLNSTTVDSTVDFGGTFTY